MKKIVLLIFCFLCLYDPLCLAEDNWKKPVEPFIQEAKEYYEAGEIEKAIESYRKVLFVDQYNARVSFDLANALEERGSLKKALREFTYCSKMIPRDSSLNESQKNELRIKVNERIDALSVRREREDPFSASRLSFVEINIVLLGFIILFFIFYEVVKGISGIVAHHRTVREQSKIWLDRYWERRKEREIRRFPLPLGPFIMHLLFLIIIIQAFFVIKREGFMALWESIALLFSSFFA